MQDPTRPVNPLLKETPPAGANVVDSSTRPPEKPLFTPPVSLAAIGKPRQLTDVTVVFMILAAMIIGFAVLTRTKLEHCVNDGSRWNTVFYLVEYGTYEYLPDWGEIKGVPKRGVGSPEEHIEKYNANSSPEDKARIMKLIRPFGDRCYRHVWDIPPFPTVDMISVKDETGQDHFYSSKPPLLSTCVAGVVIGLEKIVSPIMAIPAVHERLIGPRPGGQAPDAAQPVSTQPSERSSQNRFTFREHPMFYMRAVVLLVQLIPFLIMIWVIRQRVFEQTDSPFVQNFCVAAAALATYLTSYAVPLNNHIVAAYCALFALHATMRVWYDGRREWYWFLIAGLFGGLCHGLELPATLLTLMILAALLWKAPWRALVICLPAMVIPIAASLYTTYLVTGSVEPIPARFNEPGGPFFYKGSYWHATKDNPYYVPSGVSIDFLHEPKQAYLSHLVVGHHGFFSLTPLFIISLIGIGRHMAGIRTRRAVLMSLVLVAIVVAVGIMWKVDAGGSSLAWPRPAPPEVASTQASSGDTLSASDASGDDSRPSEWWADFKLGLACIKTAVTNPGAAIDQAADRLWGWGFLSFMGILVVVNLGMYLGEPDQKTPLLASGTLLLFLALLLLYTFTTNNYAGVSQGPRWLFWMIPFWLLMLPAGLAPLVELRVGRWLCYLCLFVSLISVFWGLPRPNEDVRATDRPFTSSWIHEFMRRHNYIDY
ncbi:MAG: hypothetical protein GX616_07420 [Planctomycetes bacterium]|nr:hypothetical protein [Planctomycetota bacterium]